MISVAVVGMNYWGPNLARNFARLANCDVRWLCDLDQALLDRHAPAYPGVRTATDLDAVLDDPGVDAVVIATSVPTHATIASRCLAVGKHCFVEKPLALAAKDARRVTAEAAAAGLVLMVDHLLVFHPAVTRLKALIDEGTLGDVYYLYGNRQNLGIVRPDENALWSLGPHDISVMNFLAGETPVEAQAMGQSYLQPGVEDVVFGLVRFASGVIGHLHLSWLDPHKMRRMTVIGSEKMAVFDDMETERKLTVYDKGPIPRTDTYGEYIQVRSGDIWIPKVPGDEPLRLVCQHFVDAIQNGTRPLADGAAGVAVVEILEAMSASIRESGRPIALNIGGTA
ncbi:MAG: Gfo/Idh/MocA family oxidoreductase [Actinobacteria bacterium]|nr:Gfo/Idh/MocA family oxidoreductase [Actinomycetota bacterium]